MVLTGQQLVDLCSIVGIQCTPFDEDCLETPVRIVEKGVMTNHKKDTIYLGRVAYLDEYPEEGCIGLDKESFL